MNLERTIQKQVVDELDKAYADGLRDSAIAIAKAAIAEAFNSVGNSEDANKISDALEAEVAKHWRETNKHFI